MPAIFSFQHVLPGPMEMLIVASIVILLIGRRFPRLVYWVGQEIAAIQQQLDQPEHTRWRMVVFLCLLAVIGWLAVLLLVDR